MHVLGAQGELAWSIYQQVEWPRHVGRFKELPDFMPDIEIRTGGQSYPNMVIRTRDMIKIPQRRFVACVRHRDGLFRFHGWCYGYEFKDYPLSDPGHRGVKNTFIHVADLHRLPFHKPTPVED